MAAANELETDTTNENVSRIAGELAVLMAAEYREVCDNTNIKLIKKCVLRNSRFDQTFHIIRRTKKRRQQGNASLFLALRIMWTRFGSCLLEG